MSIIGKGRITMAQLIRIVVAAGLADDVRSAVPPAIERVVAPDPAGSRRARARLATFRRLYPALRAATSRAGDAGGSSGAPPVVADVRGTAEVLA